MLLSRKDIPIDQSKRHSYWSVEKTLDVAQSKTHSYWSVEKTLDVAQSKRHSYWSVEKTLDVAQSKTHSYWSVEKTFLSISRKDTCWLSWDENIPVNSSFVHYLIRSRYIQFCHAAANSKDVTYDLLRPKRCWPWRLQSFNIFFADVRDPVGVSPWRVQLLFSF